MALQQFLDGQEPLLQALGVVDPVNAHDHVAEHAGGGGAVVAPLGLRRPDDLGEVPRVYADGEGGRADGAAEGADHAVLQHLATGLVHHIAVEGGQPVGGLEADEVVVEQRADQVAVARQGGEQLAGRPGKCAGRSRSDCGSPCAAAPAPTGSGGNRATQMMSSGCSRGRTVSAKRAVDPRIALAEQPLIVGSGRCGSGTAATAPCWHSRL